MNELPFGNGNDIQMPPQPNINPPQPHVGPAAQSASILDRLADQFLTDNLAEDMDEDTLREIASNCIEGYRIDAESRKEWESSIADYLDMARLSRDVRTWPWRNSSNVKYPLLATAAMQFSARAYPSLVPSNGQVVHARVWGLDPTGEKSARATRVSRYMSYQVSVEMEDWEEQMDQLLMQVAITGNMYKKTYYDAAEERFCSEIVSAADLFVNNRATSIAKAERVTHVLPNQYDRVVHGLMEAGVYLECDISKASDSDDRGFHNDKDVNDSTAREEDLPHHIIEQHTYYDIDGDGYAEPVIITVHVASEKVLRIVSRFNPKSVKLSKDEKQIVHIKPLQHFTKFGFVPSPDGSFYDMGFGHLLGPLNESVNTLVNQLIDSGTINNLQSGFIGRGLRIKGGDYHFEPGEWKWVNAVAEDLRKQIVPLPSKEPSKVLMDLLSLLIQSGKELASVAEIFVGKMPGQNTPATTTQASIEQGMKVFTAIYKRIYRALDSEFRILFSLNKVFLDHNTQALVLEEPIGPNDFDDTIMRIVPSADPTSSSKMESKAKAQELLQLLGTGVLDPLEVVKRVLIAGEHPDWEKLLPGMSQTGEAAPPPPSPEQQQAEKEAQMEQQKAQMEQQKSAEEQAAKMREREGDIAAKQRMAQMDVQHKDALNRMAEAAAASKVRNQQAADASKLNAQRSKDEQAVKAAKAKAAQAARKPTSKK